jgi:hypothetical protein
MQPAEAARNAFFFTFARIPLARFVQPQCPGSIERAKSDPFEKSL